MPYGNKWTVKSQQIFLKIAYLMQMDNIDKKLLDIIQSRFPLSSEPYQDIASLLDVIEDNVITRLKKLKDEGIIRRMGAIFDSKQMGYSSTLCAIKVPSQRVDEVAQIVNDYPSVTHNYLREDEYNMWFTITARSQSAIDNIISEIKEKSGIQNLINLPAVRTFKIEVKFSMLDESIGNSVSRDHNKIPYKTQNSIFSKSLISCHSRENGNPENMDQLDSSLRWNDTIDSEEIPLTGQEQNIIRGIQEDIPLRHSPFKSVANRLGIDEYELLSKVKELKDQGIIRRFGAILRHKKVGIGANAMGVWCVPEEKIEESGAIMATFPQVSHCYQRVTRPGWNYNVYTMIHGKTVEDCEQTAKAISQSTSITDYRLLYSVRELKKISMRYFT